MDKFKFVERPKKRKIGAFTHALRETARTGKALRVPRRQSLGGNYPFFKKEGFQLRSQREGEWLLIWLELLKEKRK